MGLDARLASTEFEGFTEMEIQCIAFTCSIQIFGPALLALFHRSFYTWLGFCDGIMHSGVSGVQLRGWVQGLGSGVSKQKPARMNHRARLLTSSG